MANQSPNRMVLGMPVVNNITDAQAMRVNQNTVEAITQSLYDSAAYPTTGIANLAFFATGLGAGAGIISGLPKTLEDTNLQGQGGAIPNLQAYLISFVELDVQPYIAATGPGTVAKTAASPAFFGAAAIASSINDQWVIRATGALVLTIGSKAYISEASLMMFPASCDFDVHGAFSNATTAAAALYSQAIYAKAVGPTYSLGTNSLLLMPMQPFTLNLQWATLEPVVTAARIFARFLGQLLRLSQ